jgi:protocatechuate 3,4-dioxygenase beta subunit
MIKINITNRWKQFLLALAIGLFVAPVYADGKATISGQVIDTNSLPIAGVTVSVKNSPSVTTNPGGMYTLTGVKQKSRVLVKFEKNGYAPTLGTISLVSKVKKEKHERDEDADEDRDDNDDNSKKLLQATLSKTMLTSGATQILDTAIGGQLSEKGFKVTFPANSLTVSGNVDVVISPLDVSTRDIQTAPGDFSARTIKGQRVTLESFSMADFTLTQNGVPVNLKPGATADIELLLPANTSLISGVVKPLWYFNQSNGLWQEEGTGFVATSTTTSGRLAIFATVKHFTYWNSDQALNSTAVRGRVVDTNGLPIAGATVEGFGVDYAGHSYAVPTDVNGNYCIQVRSSSTTSLKASLALGNIISQSPDLLVATGASQTTCATGNAQVVPNILMATQLSCISGDVKDINNLPISGALVYSTTGGFTTTDINGIFQIHALENTTVTVLVAGYPSVTVIAPPAGSPCVVALIRPSTGSGLVCIKGSVYACNPSNHYPGVTVKVSDANGKQIAVSAPSDSNGTYCIDGLPASNVLTFTANDSNGAGGDLTLRVNGTYSKSILVDTGAGGGSCAANTCNAGPGIDVYCY